MKPNTLIDLRDYTQSTGSPETRFWATYLTTKISDAMGCFSIPSQHKKGQRWGCAAPVKDQYKEKRAEMVKSKKLFDNRSQLKHVNYGRTNECDKARLFLEGSEFDEVCSIVGYGSVFVNRAFAMVQEAITLEKKLYDEFKKDDK